MRVFGKSGSSGLIEAERGMLQCKTVVALAKHTHLEPMKLKGNQKVVTSTNMGLEPTTFRLGGGRSTIEPIYVNVRKLSEKVVNVRFTGHSKS